MNEVRPSLEDVRKAAAELGMTLSAREAEAWPALISGTLASLARLHELSAPPRSVPARAWRKPRPEEDPLNAFAALTDICERNEGKLAGRTVAIKDNVSLAGVPLGDGTSLLDGYIPDFDASVVKMILEAGGRIVGKANCECLCASGASFTGANGPVRNPRDPTRSAGGSSSGSAAAVAAGLADLAIGGDQGGSIRVPAALCGVVGLKPTFGLTPYSGIVSVDGSLDHAGPISRTVADNALLLSVIAGADGLDPRQTPAAQAIDYVAACSAPIAGLRIGRVAEGFDRPGAQAGVNAAVDAALAGVSRAGADVRALSVPLHAEGVTIWLPVILMGTLMGMRCDGGSIGLGGLHMPELVAKLSGWGKRADELSDVLRVLLVAGQLATRQGGFAAYAQAQNLGRDLAARYDAALAEVDVLAMPTTPAIADPLPGPQATLEERFGLAVGTVVNTAPFDLTGHPAITVPCGKADGLPVGLMLIARRGAEATLYRAAAAIEATAL